MEKLLKATEGTAEGKQRNCQRQQEGLLRASRETCEGRVQRLLKASAGTSEGKWGNCRRHVQGLLKATEGSVKVK